MDKRLIAGIILLIPWAAAAQPLPTATGGAPAPASRLLLPFEIVRLDSGLDAILAPDTRLDTIATVPGLSGEGPMWRDGELWVSDQKGGNIYAIGLDGSVTLIAEMAGGPVDLKVTANMGPNGEVTDKDGSVLVARQAFRDIGRRNRDGSVSAVITHYQGKRFNSPNDLVLAADGTLWFTDPPYGLPGFRRQPGDTSPPPDKQLPFNGVFRYQDGNLTAVVTDMTMPNGIGLSPDGRILYVDNTSPDMYVRAYDVARDGTLSNARDLYRFEPGGGRGAPDGLKVDSLGNVWLCGPGGVNIISPAGKLLGRIQLPVNASNLAFGDDLRSVFFTSGSTIYRLRALIKGEAPAYFEK